MVTLFCTNERVFDISFSLFYPYITKFTSFENSKFDNFNFEYNGLPFFCKCLSHSDFVHSEDIICIPDSTVENYKNNYQLFSQFKNNKKISFFTEGEAYLTNDGIFHFLDIGGKIITSSIKSKIYTDNNFVKELIKIKKETGVEIKFLRSWNLETENKTTYSNIEKECSDFIIDNYIPIIYKNSKYKSFLELLKNNSELIIKSDFSFTENYHPNKKCHKIISDSIIQYLK